MVSKCVNWCMIWQAPSPIHVAVISGLSLKCLMGCQFYIINGLESFMHLLVRSSVHMQGHQIKHICSSLHEWKKFMLWWRFSWLLNENWFPNMENFHNVPKVLLHKEGFGIFKSECSFYLYILQKLVAFMSTHISREYTFVNNCPQVH